jgi:hypothetical protein
MAMTEKNYTFNYFTAKLLSVNTKKRPEVVFVSIAIISFILHLALIALVEFKVLESNSKLPDQLYCSNHTPFSILFLLMKAICLYIIYQNQPTIYR